MLFLLILILVIIVSLLVVYNKPSITAAVFGSGEITPSFKESEDDRFKDAYNVGSKFFEVNLERNAEILEKLFFEKPYEEYPMRTNACKTYPYIRDLIKGPELQFSDEDYIFDINYQPQLCYIQQSCKHKNVSYSYSNYTPHNGTLKLTLCGMQTLKYLPIDATSQPYDGVPEKYTCVIVRANPAIHVEILASMFRNVKFIVYDRMDCKLTGRNIEFHKEIFTDAHVEIYKGKIDILFTDIYQHGYEKFFEMDDPLFNDIIFRDVVLQQDWIKTIAPKYAGSMRFRPPYYNEAIYDIQGSKFPKPDQFQMIPPTEQLFEPFLAKSSTEIRLSFTPEQYNKPLIFYNYQRHEAVCLTHNMRRAWCTYAPGITTNGKLEPAPEFIEIPEYDRCLDCTYFVNIVAEHIKKFNESNYSTREVIDLTKTLIHTVSSGVRDVINAAKEVKVDGFTPSRINKYTPHGMWRDLPKVEAHVKYIEFYEFIEENKRKAAH